MAFIVDKFNKYSIWDREHSVYKFEINENWYAVFQVELEWGLPQLEVRADIERDLEQYQVYGELEDAMRFVREIKKCNR